MTPQLVPEYHRARSVVIVSSAMIILRHYGIAFKGSLPILNLNILEEAKIPYILGCILVYGVVRLILEWYQSEPERRRRMASRIDLVITLIIFLTASFFLAKELLPSLTFTSISLLPSFAIIVVGIATGEFLDISIFNLFLIRSKEGAKLLKLPRIPVAVRASWRIGYIVIPALLLVLLLSPSFKPPMSLLWPWLLCIPILLIFISGMLSLLFKRHTNKDGKRISRREFIRNFRKVFDRHDADYQVGGWDEPIPSSNTQLYDAASQGDKESLVTLIDKGEKLDTLNEHGWTALMIAVAQQHEDTALLLLEKGANPNISNVFGRNAIMYAASYGNARLVKGLLQYGADPNLNDSNDFGALSAAAVGGHSEIVELLLNSGADPAVKDEEGKSPKDYAELSGKGEIAAILRRAILSLNSKQ